MTSEKPNIRARAEYALLGVKAHLSRGDDGAAINYLIELIASTENGAITQPSSLPSYVHHEGLSKFEAECAIRTAIVEKEAVAQRGREQRWAREAFLRKQGYTEDQIKVM